MIAESYSIRTVQIQINITGQFGTDYIQSRVKMHWNSVFSYYDPSSLIIHSLLFLLNDLCLVLSLDSRLSRIMRLVFD
jgi:hypothetical protein